MGSHLSTEHEAAQALGGLLTETKYSGVTGTYFDGFEEIPSSVESRDESKARSVWEQSARLAGLQHEETPNVAADSVRDTACAPARFAVLA
jgi:hypothetical protein